MLQCPAALADHPDRPVFGCHQPLNHAQQFGGARCGRDIERDQRPVPVAGQAGGQLVEGLVRDVPRRWPGLG